MSFLFFLDFSKSENCFGIRKATFRGVKEKEKIDLTTLSAFKNTFFGFFFLPIFGVKGFFLGFFLFSQNLKTVLESEQAHLGGSKKGKNQFDHSFCF